MSVGERDAGNGGRRVGNLGRPPGNGVRRGGARQRGRGRGTVAVVMTHRRPQDTAPALRILQEVARSVGATLRFDEAEVKKHQLTPAPGLELGAFAGADDARGGAGGDAAGGAGGGADICFALGGDGTILSALRRFAGTGVPVFAVNFGEIGFLATIERDQARAGFERAFAGEYDVLSVPGIEVRGEAGEWLAINDVSIQRRQGQRVANLAYSVGSDEIGRVRCDGLVIATPAGSTGYNLANGGPVLAWGVEGFVVSFIAPHSLTARALVVAPSDVLVIHNLSAEDEVGVVVDGRPAFALGAGAGVETRFVNGQGRLAQLEGVNFYERLRTKFGRLATLP